MGSTINALFQFLLLHVIIKMKKNRIVHTPQLKSVQADEDYENTKIIIPEITREAFHSSFVIDGKIKV